MSDYQRKFAIDLCTDLKALKKNPTLRKQLEKKIEEILKDPHHYKSLRNVLKNRRRVHMTRKSFEVVTT